MHALRFPRPNLRALLFAALAAATVLPLAAQPNNSSSLYPPLSTGTSLEATADPLVARPPTRHCDVTLLTNQAFANFNNEDFNFTPPANCPGPWAKVVFTADFSIQAGVQYDRTGQLFLGGVNIYFGTTAQPLQSVTNTWHVERDLTDYASLFKTPQTGYAILGNIVGEDGLTSTIFGTFKLEFYQADFGSPAPTAADLVLPLPNNGTATLNSTTPELSETFTLPRNVERAYIDVVAQSQNSSGEEQWFLCLPTSDGNLVAVCGNTAFRQVDVSIDGQQAGVAPVYPWIYTGGIDPGLWIPIPGVQTLNLLPYRVDLTPFAGVLSNGQPHTVGVTVFNAFNYFATTAALLVYEDHGSKQVTGEVTEDTLTVPNPKVVNNITLDASGNGGGTVTVTSAQQFTVAGYVNTSHGRVGTKIAGNVNFSNTQKLISNATQFGQTTVQSSMLDQNTTTQTGPFATTKSSHVSYPFSVSYLETVETNGNIDQSSTVDQKLERNESEGLARFPIFQSTLSNEVSSTDQAVYVPSPTGYSLGSNSGQSSKQTYVSKDSLGRCYSRELTASNNILNTVTDGKGCPRW